MKKIVYILSLLIAIVGLEANKTTYNFYETFKNIPQTTFCYVYNAEDLKNYKNTAGTEFDKKMVKNGAKYMFFFKNIKETPKSTMPQYMQAETKLSTMQIKMLLKNINAKIIFNTNYEETKILYCYVPSFSEFKILNNKKVNLQIAITNNKTIFGYPMIYGSF